MKRALLLTMLLFLAAGYVLLQTTAAPAPNLAAMMPGGALLYLEAPDFGKLLREWDSSKVKADWLESTNYEVFSRSNLFTKLEEVYGQYGEAAGWVPGLQGAIEIAGTNSALALYGIRDVEFLYVSRIGDGELMKSQLWMLRDKFEQRQAGGVSFYLRTDAASKRTLAFAFARGYLLLATRDDLIAQALELQAGGANPSIVGERWYRDAKAAAANPGELRLVMNLESLVGNVYFRSYWVQRNASDIRQYWAGVSDWKRDGGDFTESRVFLRRPDAAVAEPADVSGLLALIPPNAGLYKAIPGVDAGMIVQKLIGSQTGHVRDWRDAPGGVSPDGRAGSEGDLETRIDAQPLPRDAGISDSVSAVREMAAKAGGRAVLLVQSSTAASGPFVQTPAAIVIEASGDWDRDAVRSGLAEAAGKLWTTGQLGARWVSAGAIERLDGLGSLAFAIRGRRLFLANDEAILTAVLTGSGTAPAGGTLAYAAGFSHSRERENYKRMMTALDFTLTAGNAPSFFSGNVASLSDVLSNIAEMRVTDARRGAVTYQTVNYRVAR
jgi:hypothetical protein